MSHANGEEHLSASTPEMPDELSPRRIWRRLVGFALVGVVIVVLVVALPGLGKVREAISQASPGWLVAAVVLRVFSTLAYIVLFRAVFCPRMSWRLSYQIGMSEQGANSLLSVSGAGGLALGAWALRRGGMPTEHIARRSVAFFCLTSMANVATLIVFALLYATGILANDRDPPVTYVFAGVGALAAAIVVLGLPRLRPPAGPPARGSGRLAQGLWFVRHSLGDGVRDGLLMLRKRPLAILAGSFGVTLFDIAALGACFKGFGYLPPIGVLVVAYLIGQLGGNVPIPGGIGGLDAGLIGTFALYHQPLAVTTAAVLVYHAITLWIPGLLGSIAFVQLRRTLRRGTQLAAICAPLAEPVETARPPLGAGAGRS